MRTYGRWFRNLDTAESGRGVCLQGLWRNRVGGSCHGPKRLLGEVEIAVIGQLHLSIWHESWVERGRRQGGIGGLKCIIFGRLSPRVGLIEIPRLQPKILAGE